MSFLILVLLTLVMNCSRVCAQPPKELTNSIGMKMVLIPKGRFLMGSPGTEAHRFESELQHEVTISQDYYLGANEVTQGQYLKLMGKNPSFFQGEKIEVDSSNHPVEQVSWEDAVEFCRRLSSLPEEKKTGRVYRLPTESEWEYASRAGSKTAYSFGEDTKLLAVSAWYSENSDYVTHGVGQRKANAWGLYDMHGNVWEWCQDWMAAYDSIHLMDPTGPSSGSRRVIRGGGWNDGAASCRSASRDKGEPKNSGSYLGFRLALSPSGLVDSK